MKIIKDTKLRGHAMIFDGILDLANSTHDAIKQGASLPDYQSLAYRSNWLGRTFSSWEQVVEACRSHWPKGMDIVKAMIEELKKQPLPQPKSRKRKARWSEDDGEVEVGRFLAGESAFYRDVRRDNVHGPETLTLLCNLDASGGIDHNEIFWRGAAAVAICDLLEDAGYSCEVWMWGVGDGTWNNDLPTVFTAVPLKKAGAPLDLNCLVAGLSAWFLRSLVFHSYLIADRHVMRGWGQPNYNIGKWVNYIPANQDDIRHVPMAETALEAVHSAYKILKELQ